MADASHTYRYVLERPLWDCCTSWNTRRKTIGKVNLTETAPYVTTYTFGYTVVQLVFHVVQLVVKNEDVQMALRDSPHLIIVWFWQRPQALTVLYVTELH